MHPILCPRGDDVATTGLSMMDGADNSIPPSIVEGYGGTEVGDNLATRVLKDFTSASSARLFQETQVFIRALYNSRAYYLVERDQDGGSNTTSQAAVNSTRPKLQTAESLLMPIVCPPGQECFTIDPDPEAMDPKDAWELLQQKVPPDMIRDVLFQKAGKKADRLTAKIKKGDDFTRMSDKLLLFLWDFITFGTGVMMGPLAAKNPEVSEAPTEDEEQDSPGWTPTVGEPFDTKAMKLMIDMGLFDEYLPQMERICPLDIYPDPAASTVEMARFMIWRMSLGKGQVMGMAEDKSFRQDVIKKILIDHPNGIWQPTYWETSVNSLNKQPQQTLPNGRFVCYQWWGYLTGRDLAEVADLGEKIPKSRYDERVVAQIWVMANKVIKVAISELHNERLPFYFAPYSVATNTIWGVGVAEMMFDQHDGIQACERALMDAMAMAIAPQMIVDIDQLADPSTVLEIKPRKIWAIRGKVGATREPITFFLPEYNFQAMLQVQQNEERLADEQTGLPRFLNGNQDGAHNRTLGGASLQWDNSLTTLKTAVYNIENNLIVPMTNKKIRFFQTYSKDPLIKGSYRVTAHGVKGLLARESLIQAMSLLLQNVGNIPEEVGRLKMSNFFASYLRYSGLVNEDLVYSDSEYQQIQQQKAQEAQQNAAYNGGIQASVNAQPKLRAELPPKDALVEMVKEAPENSPLRIAYMQLVNKVYGFDTPEIQKAMSEEDQMAHLTDLHEAHGLGHDMGNRPFEAAPNTFGNHPHLQPPMPVAGGDNGTKLPKNMDQQGRTFREVPRKGGKR